MKSSVQTQAGEIDEPIELAKGKPLRTLRDAANHILTLPIREAEQQHWQTAMACLLSAAERRGLVMMARIAVVRALSYQQEAPAQAARRKSAKRYRIVS